MNKERMIELAEFLESLDRDRFDLRSYFAERLHDEDGFAIINDQGEPEQFPISHKTFFKNEDIHSCNTTACIAGWAIAKFKHVLEKEVLDHFYSGCELYVASNILGLEDHEAAQIFYADSASLWFRFAKYFGLDIAEDNTSISKWYDVHPKHAAEMLRMLANEEISFVSPEKDY